MDNFDKNQVDNELLQKVDEILTGERKKEHVSELVFSDEVPRDQDISAELYDAAEMAEAEAEVEVAGNAGFKPDVHVPDGGFDYDAPEAPDFQAQGYTGETWQSLKEKREGTASGGKNASSKDLNTRALIGFIIGLIAILVSLFGMALGILPVVLGIIFSNAGRKSDRRKMAIAGLVMNIIGAVLWVIAVARGFSL